MIYLISDSELRVLCSASGLIPNVRSPLVEFLAEKTQIEGRMLDENRRGLVELGLFERTETNDETRISAEGLLLSRILMRPENVLTVGRKKKRRRALALLLPKRDLVCVYAKRGTQNKYRFCVFRYKNAVRLA